MLTFKQYLKEVLSQEQRNWVDQRMSRIAHHKNLFDTLPSSYDRVDNDRFIIPLNDDVDRTTENHISSLLSPNQIKIKDYINNIAVDKHDREISIPRALVKLGHDPNLYASDARIQNKHKEEISSDTHEILISRHPYDIGGMASDRDRETCMTLPGGDSVSGGSHYHKIENDLQHGTLIAYLVKKGTVKPNQELTKDQVDARVLIKKHEPVLNADDDIYRPEGVYSPIDSTHSYNSFTNTINDFCNKHWKMQPDSLYRKQPDLYDDNNKLILGYLYKNEQYAPQKFSPEHANQYLDFIRNKEEEQTYSDTDRTFNPLRERLKLSNNPNLSAKTLTTLIPEDDYLERFNVTGNGYSSPDEDLSELLDNISNHKNANTEVWEDLAYNHNHQQSKDKLSTHPDTDEYTLDELVNSHKKTKHPIELIHNIAMHPNTNSSTLYTIYTRFPRDHELIKKVASHHNIDDDLHKKMLSDIEHGNYDPQFSKELLHVISNNSSIS